MAYDWVKLWIEMLDDRKTASLPDSLWRRFVECILLAAEVNDGGRLPAVNDMAWRVRVDVDTMSSDLSRLSLSGLTELMEDGVTWKVTNFAKRQSFIPVGQRVASHRARKKAASNAAETQMERDSNEGVTNRYTDKIRIDKNRLEERESRARVESRAPQPEPTLTTQAHPAIQAMYKVTTYWPGEIAHPIIIEKLGDTPDIKALERAYQLWMSSGYNPKNFDGIGEWYKELARDISWTPQARFQRNGGGSVQTQQPTVSRSEKVALEYAAKKRAILGGAS